MIGIAAAVGETSRRCGVGIEAIRFHERKGIAPPPVRTEIGRRRYGSAGVERLGLPCRCRDLVFPLPMPVCRPAGRPLNPLSGRERARGLSPERGLVYSLWACEREEPR